MNQIVSFSMILLISIMSCKSTPKYELMPDTLKKDNELRKELGLLVINKFYDVFIVEFPKKVITKEFPSAYRRSWLIFKKDKVTISKVEYRDSNRNILSDKDLYVSGNIYISPYPDISATDEYFSVIYNYTTKTYRLGYGGVGREIVAWVNEYEDKEWDYVVHESKPVFCNFVTKDKSIVLELTNKIKNKGGGGFYKVLKDLF